MTKDEFSEKINNSHFLVLNDIVYEYVLSLIVEHKYEPRQKINMSQIADDLGTSRTPVKAALERLESEGLVRFTTQKGYEVCKIELQDCLSLYDTRRLIEGYAAGEAAMRRTAEDLNCLEEIIERSMAHARANDLVSFLQDDVGFHRYIVKIAGNRHLLEAYDHLVVWMRLYQHLVRSFQQDSFVCKTAIDKHSIILKMIKAHYSTEAKAQAERHVQDIYFDLSTNFSEKHQRFDS